MYICEKCIKGNCRRYPEADTTSKDGYKCDNCGYILKVKRTRMDKVLFYIEADGISDKIKERATKHKVKLMPVPLNIKEWSPQLKANIEAYNVFNDLVNHPMVLAYDEKENFLEEREIIKELKKNVE